MALEDTKKLTQTNSENTANSLIAEGWTLLLLEPVLSEGEHFVRYHLGWQNVDPLKPIDWKKMVG